MADQIEARAEAISKRHLHALNEDGSVSTDAARRPMPARCLAWTQRSLPVRVQVANAHCHGQLILDVPVSGPCGQAMDTM